MRLGQQPSPFWSFAVQFGCAVLLQSSFLVLLVLHRLPLRSGVLGVAIAVSFRHLLSQAVRCPGRQSRVVFQSCLPLGLGQQPSLSRSCVMQFGCAVLLVGWYMVSFSSLSSSSLRSSQSLFFRHFTTLYRLCFYLTSINIVYNHRIHSALSETRQKK